MAMTAMSVGTPRAAATRMTPGENLTARRAPRDDGLRRAVAAALAQESSLRLAESIRVYASQSRASGDSIHQVLDVLMNLAQSTIPKDVSLAKWSCDVAEWAIAGYFEESQSIQVAICRARANPRRHRASVGPN